MNPNDRVPPTAKDRTPPEPVEKEEALQHSLLTIRRALAGGAYGFERWSDAEAEATPLPIYDLNGKLLFYEYTVRHGDRVNGVIRASASRLLGSPVIAIYEGPRGWDPQKAVEEARARADKRFKGAPILSTELVCYCYPKIGVRVDLQGAPSVIYDAASFEPVSRFGSDEREGMTAYSFYDEVATRSVSEKRLRSDFAARELEMVRRTAPQILSPRVSATDISRFKDVLAASSSYEFLPITSWRVLKYGPRCSPHDCFQLYAQQTDVYCAVATGQMILDFYRYNFTQDQIAAAMATDAGGTTNPNQVTGYNSLSNNGLVATYDATADWAEAKAEIDANRPLKSGIPGHARACAGWMRNNIFLIGQQPTRWLRIYDPWPWNSNICSGGAVVWEDWDSVNHTNFIYVRHS
jgi:hypothetical protein